MMKPLIPTKFRIETKDVLPAPCHRCGKHIDKDDHAGFMDHNLHCSKCHNHLLYAYVSEVNIKAPIIPKGEKVYFIFLVVGLIWIFLFGLMELIDPNLFNGFLPIGFGIMALPYYKIFFSVLIHGLKRDSSYFDRTSESNFYDSEFRSFVYVSNVSILQAIFVIFLNFQIGITLAYISPFRHMYDIIIRIYNRIVAKKMRKDYQSFFLNEKTTDRTDTLYHMSITGELETFKESHLEYLKKRTKINTKDLVIDNQSKISLAKNVNINDAFNQLIDFTLWNNRKEQYFKYSYHIEKV